MPPKPAHRPSRFNMAPNTSYQSRASTPTINRGRAARDRGEKPVSFLKLPRNMAIKDPSKIMADIGNETSTYIWFDRKFEFAFWGLPDDVKQAVTLLETNISQANPTFQHHSEDAGPPQGIEFEAMGCFVWPCSEFPPERELGQRNFEQLNPIRTEFGCKIEYNVTRSAFVVRGDAKGVETALDRIKGLLYKAVARQNPLRRRYLVRNQCQKVHLTSYALPAVFRSGSAQAPRVDKTFKTQGPRQKTDSLLLAKEIRNSVMQTLGKIHRHQGHIDLRVHMGTLLLKKISPFSSLDLTEYKSMIADPSFEGCITEELGDKIMEDGLLDRFLKATGSLRPNDRFVSNLADTKPEYMGSIEVDTKDGQGNVVITRRYDQVSDREPVYTRQDGRTGRSKFLEIYMSDMVSDFTWLLDMTAAGVQNPSQLPKWVTEHGAWYVEMEREKAAKLQAFCNFESYNGRTKPLANKRGSKEKITWTFELLPPHSGYEVELAKVFNKEYTASTVGGKEEATVFEARWTVDVRHREWATQLSENQHLEAGMGAPWRADMKTWFPVETDDAQLKLKGHVELLNVLERVQDIVLGKSP